MVAMEGSCIFSAPSGNLNFQWFQGTCEDTDTHFFTSFTRISVLQIREPWVGQRTVYRFSNERTSGGATNVIGGGNSIGLAKHYTCSRNSTCSMYFENAHHDI